MVVGKPLWHAITPAGPRTGPLEQDSVADVAVIGAGFLGLSAATMLARAGMDVAVLEGSSIGAGASGRNAGFVVPHFSRADPSTLAVKMPGRAGERLLSLLEGAADRVFDLARKLSVDAQAEQSGWLQPAHGAAAAQELRRLVDFWQARDRPVRWLDADTIRARTGISIYDGALEDASGGTINPLAFLCGLARRAIGAGARVYTRTSVEKLVSAGIRRNLQLSTGATLRARNVLLATNGAMTGAARHLGRTVLPLSVYQIATEPMADKIVARIALGRQPVSDTRTNIFTYRLTPDNRLVSGGMALLPVAAEGRMSRRIAGRLQGELGLPDVPRIDYVWRGTAAMTGDGLPALASGEHGVLGAVGCNGRGVAFATVFGEAIGRWMANGGDPQDAPLPVMRARALPMRPLTPTAASLVLLRGLWHDHAVARGRR